MNGFMTKYNNYNNSAIPVTLEQALNNSTVSTRYLDGPKNRLFKYTIYPKYMDIVKQSALVFADVLPTRKQWLTVAAPNVTHRSAVTQWWGAVQNGLPIALANTGYLLYKYTLYFSFRQRVTSFLQ